MKTRKTFECEKCGKREKISNLDEGRLKWRQLICDNCNDAIIGLVKETCKDEIDVLAIGFILPSLKFRRK